MARQSYLPPSPQDAQGLRASGAATALRLLECNPESLLRTGRQSAAKLARQRYEELVKAPQRGDLLDFETPTCAPKDPGEAESLPGSVPGNLWPGDTVLARYGVGGRFFRARVVRVYSSRGSSLADVEWLSLQGAPWDESLSPSLDAALHRHGLQVGTDLRSLEGSRPQAFPALSGAPPEALPDLLDLSLEATAGEQAANGRPVSGALIARSTDHADNL
ncbi:unnamed protein product [Effrenium voratum]|nr:unnamed protein product [Effrenium voratum]